MSAPIPNQLPNPNWWCGKWFHWSGFTGGRAKGITPSQKPLQNLHREKPFEAEALLKTKGGGKGRSPFHTQAN